MAEFALGLTKTAVEGTLSRVKSAIEEEGKQRERVQEDLMFITGEFQMMQAFLNASSAGERASKNLVARAWVRQLRDLAFDVEDCVEFVVSLDKPSPWDWVQRLTCLARPPLPLDLAVAEIKRLKARVEDVSQRNTRYNLIGGNDSSSSSDQQHNQLLSPAISSASAAAAAFQDLRDVWKAMGKLGDHPCDLKRLIDCQGDELKVISLWRRPQSADVIEELGWATIVKKAYDDPEICQEFKNRAWVKLTHPFNPVVFLNNLLTHFTSYRHHHHHDNMSELVLQVSQHRYLIVLEQELSSIADWDAIRMCLPDGENGSRVVVSTKNLGIALVCTGNPYQVSQLKHFSEDQGLYALVPKKKGYSDQDRSHDFSSRIIEARDWTENHEYNWSFNEIASQQYVTSVWGIAGVGKSHIVRTLYFHLMIDYGEEKYSWVDVPQAFSLKEFSRRLLMDFHSDDLEAKESVAVGILEGQDAIHECRNFMQENNFFVVIDGLNSLHDWDLIKAAFLSDSGPINGHIIVITNKESVARHCVISKRFVTNIQGLEAEAALTLFMKIAPVSWLWTSDMKELSRLIMSKCGGLPQVITAVGKCFHSIDESGWLEYLNANFMSILESHTIKPSLRSLFSWMKSYFDNCPDILKPCIFYLPVFPLGHNIRRKRLLRRWIAEGYSADTSGSTAEENGEKFFSELVKLSIIQKESASMGVVCQVNGFFREYIISRPMQDNLVFALEDRCTINSQRVGQHLTIGSGWDRDKILFECMELSRLRSLTIFGQWGSFFISSNVNMRLLRVLDMEDTSGVTDGDIDQIGKLLPRLKYLSLRGCKEITRLPSSLGGLRQLQTLDIKGTSIVMLPPAIMKLEKLQYIRAGGTHCMLTSTEDNIGIATSAPADGDGASTSQPPSVAAARDDEALMIAQTQTC